MCTKLYFCILFSVIFCSYLLTLSELGLSSYIGLECLPSWYSLVSIFVQLTDWPINAVLILSNELYFCIGLVDSLFVDSGK
jgi:hypothetical protein